MDFSATGGFSFSLGWRVVLTAALATAALQLLSTSHYYATALVLFVLAMLILSDAIRLSALRGRSLAHAPSPNHYMAERLSRTEALLDAVTVSLFVLEESGRIVFANRAALSMAGEDVAGLADIRSVGADAAAQLLAMPAGGRQILTMANGQPMLAWSTAFLVPGAGVQKLVSLQAVSGELDAVQVRAWSDMTRILSHEIMNSLTPIVSLSESLPDLGPGDRDTAMETIARRSRHLMTFVARYRQIAELPQCQCRTIDLADFLTDIDALMRAHLAARHIGWRCGILSAPLHADPDLLHQALINLLHNAADAASQNSAPSVALEVRRVNGEIHFSVRDNGPGISPEIQHEIFVPFFTTKPNGAGIGLALARQIALAHGGRITMETQDGAGAEFILAIPETTAAAQTDTFSA